MTRGVPGAIPQEVEYTPKAEEAPGQKIRCYHCIVEGFGEIPETIVYIQGTTYCFPHAKKLVQGGNNA